MPRLPAFDRYGLQSEVTPDVGRTGTRRTTECMAFLELSSVSPVIDYTRLKDAVNHSMAQL